MNKINALYHLFTEMKKVNKSVRYGDVLRAGYNRYTVDLVINDLDAVLFEDAEGYTVITFGGIQNGN